MLISSIVHLTLGSKDHRDVFTTLGDNELEIHLEGNSGRKLPCAVCGRPRPAKDKIREPRRLHGSLCPAGGGRKLEGLVFISPATGPSRWSSKLSAERGSRSPYPRPHQEARA
jgi:hypothetical protein